MDVMLILMLPRRLNLAFLLEPDSDPSQSPTHMRGNGGRAAKKVSRLEPQHRHGKDIRHQEAWPAFPAGDWSVAAGRPGKPVRSCLAEERLPHFIDH